jgi:WSC domain
VSSVSLSITSTLTAIETLTASTTSNEFAPSSTTIATVSTTALLDYPGAIYLGCFIDQDQTALPYHLSIPGVNTIKGCRLSAIIDSDDVFGVRNGDQCSGGTYSLNYDYNANITACTTTCADGSDVICGGPLANSVYRVSSATVCFSLLTFIYISVTSCYFNIVT